MLVYYVINTPEDTGIVFFYDLSISRYWGTSICACTHTDIQCSFRV